MTLLRLDSLRIRRQGPPPLAPFPSNSTPGRGTTPPLAPSPSKLTPILWLPSLRNRRRRRDNPSSVLIPFEFDDRRRDDPSSGSLPFENRIRSCKEGKPSPRFSFLPWRGGFSLLVTSPPNFNVFRHERGGFYCTYNYIHSIK